MRNLRLWRFGITEDKLTSVTKLVRENLQRTP